MIESDIERRIETHQQSAQLEELGDGNLIGTTNPDIQGLPMISSECTEHNCSDVFIVEAKVHKLGRIHEESKFGFQ